MALANSAFLAACRFSTASTKYLGIGLLLLRSSLGTRILAPMLMCFGLSSGFAFARTHQFSLSPVYHSDMIRSVSPW